MRLRLSTSSCIAIHPENGLDSHVSLVNADAAMYHSKYLHQPGIVFSVDDLNAQDSFRQPVDGRPAVERNELVCITKRKFDDPNGAVVGAEALVRWQHPIHGMVPPDRFIPAAEKTGLIIAIDTWVLNEACRQLKHMARLGKTRLDCRRQLVGPAISSLCPYRHRPTDARALSTAR